MTVENEALTLKKRFRGYFPVVIDVETAGFNAKTDALLEICAITLKMDENGDLHPASTLHFHIEPFEGANIEQEALDFNGIKDPFSPLRGAVSEQEALKEILSRYKPVEDKNLPRFFGGAVGFMSYDMVRFFETLPDQTENDLDLPDAVFVITETLLIFDNVSHKIKIVCRIIKC